MEKFICKSCHKEKDADKFRVNNGYRRLSCNTCVQRKRRPTKNNLGTLEMDYVVGMFIGEHKNLNMYFKPNKKRAA
jgi:hypothetical protein